MIVYSCFYFSAALIFEIRLGEGFFHMGTTAAVISMVFYGNMKVKRNIRYKLNKAICHAVLYSLVPSIICFMVHHDIIEALLSLLYNAYIWKLGYDTEVTGLKYDVYKDDFMTGLKIFLSVILLSIFTGEEQASSTTGRLSVVYIMLGLLLLKNLREITNIKYRKNEKADAMSIAMSMLMVSALLCASSETFLSYMLNAVKYMYSSIDGILSAIVGALGYAVGWALVPLINYLSSHIKGDVNITVTQNSNISKQQPLIDSLNIPYGVQIAVKLLLLAGIIYILIRIRRNFETKKRRYDFTESREFVLNFEDVERGIKKKLISALSRFKKSRTKPATLREKVRYIYCSFLKFSIKHGTYTSIEQTHRDIEKNSCSLMKECSSSIKSLTETYEKARYSNADIGDEDLYSSKKHLKEIIDKFDI